MSGPEALKRKINKQKTKQERLERRAVAIKWNLERRAQVLERRRLKLIAGIPENMRTSQAIRDVLDTGWMLINRWEKEIEALEMDLNHSDEYLLCKINRRKRDIATMLKHTARYNRWLDILRPTQNNQDPSLLGPL